MTPYNADELRPFLSPLSLDGAVEPFLVFADWLQERGDRWGNLIAIDAEIEAHDGREPLLSKVALEDERRAILLAHGASICPLEHWKNARLVYRRGFVESATLGNCGDIDPGALAARLSDLLSSPSSALLQRLDLSASLLADRHAKALIVEKDRLARTRVDVRGNMLSAATTRALRDALSNVDVSNQNEPPRAASGYGYAAESGSDHRAFIRAHGGPRSIEDIDD